MTWKGLNPEMISHEVEEENHQDQARSYRKFRDRDFSQSYWVMLSQE